MKKNLSLLSYAMFCGLSLSGCSVDHEGLRTAKLPDEAIKGALNGAIWGDIEHDTFFNGGSWANLLRSQAEQELTVDIRDMRCRSSKQRQLCAFNLVRLGGEKPPPDVRAPDGLHCTAPFIQDRDGNGWTIPRLRPGKGGSHTRTSMECEKI